jgi:hypothetical protein
MTIRIALLGALLALPAAAGSETPPAGPPWRRELLKAREEALAGRKPLFLYFTKTY